MSLVASHVMRCVLHGLLLCLHACMTHCCWVYTAIPCGVTLQLINAALDLSALFEARDDVVTRHTRFTSTADVPVILDRIEEAARQLGARAQRRDDTRLVYTAMTQTLSLNFDSFP